MFMKVPVWKIAGENGSFIMRMREAGASRTSLKSTSQAAKRTRLIFFVIGEMIWLGVLLLTDGEPLFRLGNGLFGMSVDQIAASLSVAERRVLSFLHGPALLFSCWLLIRPSISGISSFRRFGIAAPIRAFETMPLFLRNSSARHDFYLGIMGSAFVIALGISNCLIFSLASLVVTGPFLLMPLWYTLTILTFLLEPPSVLLLTKSTRQNISWAASLTAVFHYHRFVCLLDSERLDETPYHRGIFAFATLRTSDDVRWQDSVLRLMKIAQVIVCDVRSFSNAVVFEADSILCRGYSNRSIFVCSSRYHSTILRQLAERLPGHADDELVLTTERDLVSLLKSTLQGQSHAQEGRTVRLKSLLEHRKAGEN